MIRRVPDYFSMGTPMSNQHFKPYVFAPGVVSILIPVYNERAFLAKCLERVLAAKLPKKLSKEIILVDDASSDGTTQIVRDFAARHPKVIKAFTRRKTRAKARPYDAPWKR